MVLKYVIESRQFPKRNANKMLWNLSRRKKFFSGKMGQCWVLYMISNISVETWEKVKCIWGQNKYVSESRLKWISRAWDGGGEEFFKSYMHPEGNRKNRGDPTTLAFVTFKVLSSHQNQDIWALAPAGTVTDSPSVLCSENLIGSRANWQGQDQGEAVAAPSTTIVGGRVTQRRTYVQNQRASTSS